ncbi:MAG: carboxylesterase/lipase family protein [Mycobacterium sp.]
MHEHTIQVSTGSGVVEGFTLDGVNRWRSIPYAAPPVGRRRFRAPEPVSPWNGVRSGHGFGNCAPQQRMYTMTGVGKYQPMSEDCLTLNIVTPRWEGPAPDGEPLPVMFFIHGGGYILGSSATPVYDGAALARRGCVYVSVNYRLGALGCLDLSSLSTPDNPIDSNLFLRDIVLALQWVRDNIAAFGGDPGNVTIFGESAGAHAVATLLAVPAAGGLFHQAISQSPASGMASSQEIAAAAARRYVDALGIPQDNAAAGLMAARSRDLVRAMGSLLNMDQVVGAAAFGPTYGDDYLPLDPFDSMRKGLAHKVPLIVGTNADEGKLFTRFLKLLPTTEHAIEKVLAHTPPEVRSRVLGAYPHYQNPKACVEIGGDMIFNTAVWQIAEAHAKLAPTYVYRYDFAPRTLHWAGFGATHATELLAVFGIYRSRVGAVLTAGVDQRAAVKVSHQVQNRWSEFSRTGVPGDDWPVYNHEERPVMVFDRHTHIEYDPHPHRREAWMGFSFVRP